MNFINSYCPYCKLNLIVPKDKKIWSKHFCKDIFKNKSVVLDFILGTNYIYFLFDNKFPINNEGITVQFYRSLHKTSPNQLSVSFEINNRNDFTKKFYGEIEYSLNEYIQNYLLFG